MSGKAKMPTSGFLRKEQVFARGRSSRSIATGPVERLWMEKFVDG
jgi:hypothetical protein